MFNRSKVAEGFLGLSLPGNFEGSGTRWGKVQGGGNSEPTASKCLEIVARQLNSKVVIDFNQKTGFWTIKVGFLWGRDSEFDIAAADLLEKCLPLLK